MSLQVAVVIPAHDAAALVGEAVASALAQTLPAAEIVVVDDGSTDDTAAVAERRGARCVRQSNRGPGAARNAGVAATSADLLAFLDADDRFVAEKLAAQVAHLQETGAIAVCTDSWLVRGGRRDGRKNRVETDRIGFAQLMRDNPITCSTVLVRREAFERAGGFDEDPVLIASEDFDLWLRLSRLGDLAYLAQPMVDYHVHETSLSCNQRWVAGVDRIMEKVVAACGDESDVRELAARWRARVRVNAAYDLACAGQGGRARTLLREVRRLCGWGRSEWMVWLRTFWFRRGLTPVQGQNA